MFLIVTEEAVVKGHLTCAGGRAANALRTAAGKWLPRPARPVASFARRMKFDRAGSARGHSVQHDMVLIVPKGALFFAHFWGCCAAKRPPCAKGKRSAVAVVNDSPVDCQGRAGGCPQATGICEERANDGGVDEE